MISDCSENILPTLNYRDTMIFSCEVNFLSNYILLRSANTQKHRLGMTSPRNGKNQIFGTIEELQGMEGFLMPLFQAL